MKQYTLTNFPKYLRELDATQLRHGDYAIYGSGPLAAREIRDSGDLDVIVKEKAFEQLKKKYPECVRHGSVYEYMQIGHLEVRKEWWNNKGIIKKMIDTADSINGYHFVQLKYVVQTKKTMAREKDLRDLVLLEQYLRNISVDNGLSIDSQSQVLQLLY